MAGLSDLCYCRVIGKDGVVPVIGWAVEAADDEIVLATTSDLSSLEHTSKAKVGQQTVSFVRVGQNTASLETPAGWGGLKPKDLAPLDVCQSAWKKVKDSELLSSEAEATKVRKPKAQKGKGSLAADLSQLRGLFGEGDSEGEEESDSEGDLAFPPRKGESKYLPPGGSGDHSSEKKKKSKGEGDLVKQMLVKNLADGKDANEMLPAVLMAMLLDKDKGKESRRGRGASSSDYLELHGGSDSDESDADEDKAKGMKAVELLHRLHRSIRRHPKRVCEQFEKEVIEDLGIVKGQAWTLKDYVRKQQWGKFKGLYRTAIMDVEVYELLRSNQPDVAAAQVIQNLKSKMQAVMQGGDWGSAWLLTGLPDPLMKREFAGSRQEMSIISGYLGAVHRLQKRVRESKGLAGHHGEEDEESGAAGAATKK